MQCPLINYVTRDLRLLTFSGPPNSSKMYKASCCIVLYLLYCNVYNSLCCSDLYNVDYNIYKSTSITFPHRQFIIVVTFSRVKRCSHAGDVCMFHVWFYLFSYKCASATWHKLKKYINFIYIVMFYICI